MGRKKVFNKFFPTLQVSETLLPRITSHGTERFNDKSIDV